MIWEVVIVVGSANKRVPVCVERGVLDGVRWQRPTG